MSIVLVRNGGSMLMKDHLGNDVSVPVIPEALIEELAKVEPSCDEYRTEYRPCKVTLKDGRVHSRVYIVEATSYVRVWGVWPECDRAKRPLSIEEVVKIEDSPVRLPVKLANKVYAAGESGMGYYLFTLVFDDGSQVSCVTGDAVDFPDWPRGITPQMVVDVLPHVGRRAKLAGEPTIEGADYYWCLYLRPAQQ